MNIRRYRDSAMHNLPWPVDFNNVGWRKAVGNVDDYRLLLGEVAYTNKTHNRLYCVGSRQTARWCYGGGLAGSGPRTAIKGRLAHLMPYPEGGVTSVHWPMNGYAYPPQAGFSLADCLVALALLSLGILALGNYHRQLVTSLQLQWAQRNTVFAAAQALNGKPVAGFQTELIKQPQPGGCVQVTARTLGPSGRKAALTELNCPPR